MVVPRPVRRHIDGSESQNRECSLPVPTGRDEIYNCFMIVKAAGQQKEGLILFAR
jgi:hypothetical protein